jgi:N-methylhydantoinase A
VVTNALIERNGAPTGMVFTQGFADILRIRDERRYDMYDPQIEFPEPLISPAHTFTLAERTYADGTVHREPDDAAMEQLCRDVRDRGITSLGICFLHSYKNAQNERRLAARLRQALPDLYLSLSSDIAPQIREYLRASTTAANAYAVPITQPYLDRLEARLERDGFASRPLIMLSSGGVVGPGTAGRMPVRMIESGPAAGALGAAFASKALETENLLSFDMGGTTAKICLIQRSRPLVSGLFEIDRMYRFKEGSGLPVAVPCVDLIEIGAGGGSIAGVDHLGLLKVGPRSAGSRPGPACYGLGGRDATVTDASVVLGTIDAGNFLGGTMRLDSDAAHAAVSAVADRLATSTIDAARGIYRLVCETMASAVRAHAADRGVDYRGIPLLAFGGAGPVHACEVAAILKSGTVIFPPLASVYSAFGTLVTPPRLDLVRSGLAGLGDLDWDQVAALYAEMERDGLKALVEAGCPQASATFRYAADLRYRGQHYDLLVELDGRPTAAEGATMIRRRFEEDYERRYRITQDAVGVEVVNWRLTATGSFADLPPIEFVAATGDGARVTRKVHLWADDEAVRVVPRTAMPGLGAQAGPLIIEEAETTLVVPAGWTASVGPLGSIVAQQTAPGAPS